ncbi:hypothetical protein PCANC_09062 [Puccinia coronata f. sp. avenae]|uniref:Ubiquitin-like 1-activating enzyme E1A n=1 Tax=Puccinia coronata f. sp. avenae TaxID=200324 RepID=A0A2N5TGZ2_9BASI|nr:hypothetical protein PCANC_23341 [Puccinia coronata f. sp. avenae]PLW17752.1 hypothetical protein PCANC_09062 [Puccinia coronata f. sp. avenae]PLW24776.1 hypothetical protein PCASD_05189 [Puccinia coronata f. sp. avenae]PLW51460.1 hypothetical protein PCASD_00323 [Puccinia coronata f. sp. avenae]
MHVRSTPEAIAPLSESPESPSSGERFAGHSPSHQPAGNMENQPCEKNGIDEEEAALYDRQIRLWGVEAQNRMRRSSVLIINLRGIATEACKNIVLAGVGSITILDPDKVLPEDLGAGFFFREEDIGQRRVDAAKKRLHSLNPRVNVTGLTDDIESKIAEDGFLQSFDIVCLTDSSSSVIQRVNSCCRRAQKPFFAAASLGIHGYIFADLLDHTYISEREKKLDNGEVKKTSEKRNQEFIPFDVSLKSKLNHITLRRLKKVSPLLWACLALFELQSKCNVNYPEGDKHVSELIDISDQLLKAREIHDPLVPQDLLRQLAMTSKAEFIPSCAVVGSILSQEVLNALGGKQAPLANFLVFDGEKCSGDIYALGVQRDQS